MKAPDSFASSYPLEILIADDDTTRRTAMKQQLAELGYTPEEAASSEVLSMAGERRYDVIMMEVLIPGIDGILDLASPKAGQKPVFIAISSSNPQPGAAGSLPKQIDNVITRPMDRPEFLLQLKACSLLAGKCFIKAVN